MKSTGVDDEIDYGCIAILLLRFQGPDDVHAGSVSHDHCLPGAVNTTKIINVISNTFPIFLTSQIDYIAPPVDGELEGRA